MKFANNIFAMVCLINLQIIGCLFAMEYPDVCQSQLGIQIFGRRIRVENQSGIRLRIEVCRSDDKQWEFILENNSSVDIGSILDIPKRVSYMAYGNLLSWVRMACHGTILLDEINRFKEISEDKAVIVRINKGNNHQIYLNRSEKNVILPKLFPSIELYLAPGYIQGPSYSSIEEFKEKDCINFARYVIGLKSDYSEFDVNIKANRLLEEWNPALYKAGEIEIVKSIRLYIEWAKAVLLGLLEFSIFTREQVMRMPLQARNEIVRCIVEGSEQQRERLKILIEEAKTLVPPPPPLPASWPIQTETSHAFVNSNQERGCIDSLQFYSRVSPIQSQAIKPEAFQIKPSDLSEISKSLRRHSAADYSTKFIMRGVQEILPERWVEISQNPELITHNEFVLIRLKYEADEPDSTFLLNIKKLIEQASDLGKLAKLLNFLDRSDRDLLIKRKIIFNKISSKLGRDALARDIKSAPKLKKVS